MARYVDQALSPGEKILYDARVHWAIFILPFVRFFGIFVALGAGWFFLNTGVSSAHIDDADLAQGMAWLSHIPKVSIFVTIFLLIGLQGFVHAIIYYFNSDFVLTDRRVISKFGLLSRTTSEQRLSKVESIHVYQSLLGRILGFGNITVTGTGSSTTKFGPMVDPLGCKRAIEGQLDLAKHSGPGAE
jgi:uncharacterized membrane protein YdbT with pleckstrin-like domain